MSQPAARASGATRSQEVYERLRAAIVRGELRPNERLVEAELAEWLRVSRTPIRECLQRLAADGLVANRPRRGWTVLEHTPEEIREIYEIRAALEGFAARLAAQRATAAEVERIVDLASVDPERLAQPPRSLFVEHNEAFHDAVIAAAANPRLGQAIRRNREYYFNQRIAAVYTPEEMVAALGGHRRVARAIERRDAGEAESLSRDHIFEALRVAIDKL